MKWDERYKEVEFAYGKEPNLFFKEQLSGYTPGAILMPADGEGRNGVFAATLGWKVTAFDLSTEGRLKALQLAKEKEVALEYIAGDFENLAFEAHSFDAIGLIYAHFTADRKSSFHKKLHTYLKPGGIVIFEAFSKSHLALNTLNPSVGGPKDSASLFSIEELQTDFAGYEILMLEEKEISLQEGKYHIGRGSVIRFVGRKPGQKE